MIIPRLCAQSNRMAVRRGLNELFLGNPTTNPALRKVHQAMGLPGDKPVLHAEHPVVMNCGVPGEFILCPPDTHRASSLANSSIATNAQFATMLGKQSFLNHSIHGKIMPPTHLRVLRSSLRLQIIYIVSIRCGSRQFTVSKTLHSMECRRKHPMQQSEGCHTATLCFPTFGSTHSSSWLIWPRTSAPARSKL